MTGTLEREGGRDTQTETERERERERERGRQREKDRETETERNVFCLTSIMALPDNTSR